MLRSCMVMTLLVLIVAGSGRFVLVGRGIDLSVD